ncbi:MAG: DUF4143 domain-containing protein [Rectinema sp.]
MRNFGVDCTAFIIKKVWAFSRNLRSEISKSAKYYFLDVGVRNTVINLE